MKRARLFACLLALAAASCARNDAGLWEDKLAADPLYQASAQLARRGDCASLVPLQYHRGIPVPVREGGKAAFAVLFCPPAAPDYRKDNPLLSPRFAGTFELDSPDSARCTRLAGTPVPSGPPLSDAARRLSWAEMTRQRMELYDLSRRAADLYFAGAEPTPGEKTVLASYAAHFSTLAEPGLLPYYYRLNPDFWEWLRRETGESIPKA